MKTKIFAIAMLIAVSMVSCRKEDGLIPMSANNKSHIISLRASADLPACESIVADDGTITIFQTTEEGILASVQSADGSTRAFESDADGNVVQLIVKDLSNTTYYRWKNVDAEMMPLSITKFIEDAKGGLIKISGIEVHFENGLKIAEREVFADKKLRPITTSYSYDDQGRLVSISKTQNGKEISSMKVAEFEEGKNELISWPELAIEPGVGHQSGLPRVIVSYSGGINSEERTDYELNENQMPVSKVVHNENGSHRFEIFYK